MILRVLSVGLLVFASTPVHAAEPAMTAAEFEAYVEGKTLYYSGLGGNFGIEQYLSGRRVIWQFLNGECEYGKWYESEAGQICFVYEEDPVPKCWTFRSEDGALAAKFESQPMGAELYEARQTRDPLQCRGPEVGT
jgi:hypothetical protein